MLVVVARVAELRRDHVQRDAIFQHDSRVAVACTVQRDRRDACGHHEPPPPAYAAKQDFEQALNVAIATPATTWRRSASRWDGWKSPSPSASSPGRSSTGRRSIECRRDWGCLRLIRARQRVAVDVESEAPRRCGPTRKGRALYRARANMLRGRSRTKSR